MFGRLLCLGGGMVLEVMRGRRRRVTPGVLTGALALIDMIVIFLLMGMMSIVGILYVSFNL